jgi:tetratricopeptide (TPR) repeat protein
VNPKNFFAELKRRNVYKVAVAYAVVAWLLVQIATQVFPFFEIPNWAVRLVVIAIVVGFPIALIIAWAFELTPQGLKRTKDVDFAAQLRTKSHAWIYVVIAAGAISVALFFLGRYTAQRTSSAEVGRRSATSLPEKSIPMAYDQYAWVLTVFGRFDEALAKERKALELDPLSPFMNGNLGAWLYGARRYDEAIAQLRRTFEFDPNSALAHFFLGWCSLGKGNAADATAEFEKAKTLDDLPMYEGALGCAYAISGDRAKAEQVLGHLEDASKQRYVSAGSRAYVYLGLGDREKIYEWLEKGYEERDWICFWLNVDPIFDRLRNEARVQALVKKVGLHQ